MDGLHFLITLFLRERKSSSGLHLSLGIRKLLRCVNKKFAKFKQKTERRILFSVNSHVNSHVNS